MAPHDLERAKSVGDLTRRIDEILHVDHSLSEALVRMRGRGTAMLPVADGDEVVGVLTREAILQRAKREHRLWRRAKVADQMARHLLFCYETDALDTAKDTMERGRARHLLVVNSDDELVGTITIEAVTEALGVRHRSNNAFEIARRRAERRFVETGARARSRISHQPETYSTKPKLKKQRGR